MQINRPSNLKVVLIALAFGAALVMTQPRTAHAYEAAGIAVVVIAVATYAAVKATVCTPIAMFKASNHANGFTGAFRDCFRTGEAQSIAAATKEDAVTDSNKLAVAESEDSSRPEDDPVPDETWVEAPTF